jgi:hypothetical protein
MQIIDHATIAMKRPAGPPAATRETSALAGGAWFEAATPAGMLRLYAARTVRHAADAAVALGRCESLLAALDAWLAPAVGAALDWRWIAHPGAVTASATHARVHWQPAAPDDAPRTLSRPDDKADVACRLELPWTLLRSLPAPTAATSAQLQWPEIPMVLAASQWQIGDDELALLEPGGAVVLPASMQAGWRGWLRGLDERAAPGASVPVDLAQPAAPRRAALEPPVAGSPAGPAPLALVDATWCEIRLTLPHALPGDRLAGWFEGTLVDGSHAAAASLAASLWHLVPGQPARCLAMGTLMPWADGWALAVEQVGI